MHNNRSTKIRPSHWRGGNRDKPAGHKRIAYGFAPLFEGEDFLRAEAGDEAKRGPRANHITHAITLPKIGAPK